MRNEATVEEGVALAKAALKGELKYSLWLMPVGAEGQVLDTEIAAVCASHGMAPFPPHVTPPSATQHGVEKVKVWVSLVRHLLGAKARFRLSSKVGHWRGIR